MMRRLGLGTAANLALPGVTAALLSACSPSPRGDGLFPLAEGRRWDYAVTVTREETTEPPQRDRLTFHNRGAEDIKGEPAWRRRSASGIDYWLRSDETGIYRVASKTDLQYDPQPDAERRYVLKQPMALGTTWEADTTVYVLQRRNEFAQTQYTRNKSIKMTYSVVAVGEKLSTPAGNFEGCVHVQGIASIKIFVDAMGAWRDSPVTTHEWYCLDVGLVRLRREEPSASILLSGGTLQMDLLAWR